MGIEPTREEFEGIDDYEDGPEEDPVQEPGLDERLERNKHRWNMAAGPVHEHDSECCVYLGTVEGWGGNPHRDLYFCAQHGNPTVISREGAFGEYTSGLDFIDVDRHLALAYTRAHSLGLL
jgi:hypothetical protein